VQTPVFAVFQAGSISSSVTVDVKSAAVTEEVVIQETVTKVEAVVEQKAVVEKVAPRLEEFPKPQALREPETLVLSCKVWGQLTTYSMCMRVYSFNCRLVGYTRHAFQHVIRSNLCWLE